MPSVGRRKDESVDVLVVCTGNVCRSPYLAARLRAALPALTVRSAGAWALVGQLPTPEVLEMLVQRGVRDDAQPARLLDSSMIRGARLVITAERRHRGEAVFMDRTAAERVFTVKELARLVAPLPDGAGLDEMLEHARSGVAADAAAGDHDDDLADPYGRERSDYERMADEADELVAALVRVLRS